MPSPFDSYAGRLSDAMRKTSQQGPPKDTRPTTKSPSPFDSYAGRLDDALKRARGDSPPAPPAQDSEPDSDTAEQNAELQPGASPVGSGDHVVRTGDCMSSIAFEYGHYWEALWNDPANAELRERRQDPNVLLPGDRVTVKERQTRQEPGETEQVHRFRVRSRPARLIIQVKDEGEPRANEPYTLKIAGSFQSGSTDGDGVIDVPVPPAATKGVLTIGAEETVFHLKIGHLDPYDSVSGAQGRLSSLGYDPGPIDGELGPKTRKALKRFQLAGRLKETGELDTATCEKLREEHGS